MTGARHYMPRKEDGDVLHRPPVGELMEHCARMDTLALAEHYGTTTKRVRDWLYRAGLKPLRREATHGQSAVERDYPDRNALIAYIESTEINDAADRYSTDVAVCSRWERVHGARFKRLCRHCKQALPYSAMHSRADGRIYKICRECYRSADRVARLTATSHLQRVTSEYEGFGAIYAKIPWSGAQGINGWLRFQGRDDCE